MGTAHAVLTSAVASQNSVMTQEMYISADCQGTGVCTQNAAFDD